MQFRVTEDSKRRLAGLHHRGDYRRMSGTFATLFPHIEKLQNDGSRIGELVAVYNDDPNVTAEADLSGFAAVTLEDDSAVGELTEIQMPASKYAVLEFVGTHPSIPNAWVELNEQLRDNNQVIDPDRASFEVYCNQPEGTPEAELRTDLYRPIL